MRYIYTFITNQGKELSDVIVGRSKEQVLGRLQNKGVQVNKIRTDYLGSIRTAMTGSFFPIPFKDKLVFTRNLAMMLRAGITLDEALLILSEQSTSTRLSRIAFELNEGIQAGRTFASVLSDHDRDFSQLYINVVAAAEQSGNLSTSLDQLAEQLNQQYELRSKIRSALFYPAIVVSATFTVGVGLAIFVLPKITKLFDSFDTQLPLTTRILITFSNFVAGHTFLVAFGLVFFIIGFIVMIRLPLMQPFWHIFLLHFPVIGKMTHYFNVALFTRTLGTLLTSGVPINEALQITGDTFRNTVYRKAVQSLVSQQQTGESLGLLLRSYPDLFSPIVHRMISVSEESGNLEEVLSFLSEFHENEIDYMARNLSTTLEPLMLLVLGAGVLLVALAIITPIYQITGSFQVT